MCSALARLESVPRLTLTTIRKLALALPGAEEGTSYGTPAFRVRKKLFARMHEGGETMVVKVDFDTRELLLETQPNTFLVTDHYQNYPMVVVRLDQVSKRTLGDLLEQAWRPLASKQQIAELDG